MTNTKMAAKQVTAMTVPALFDAHVHFREGMLLPHLVAETARCCDYAVVMPNTSTPRTTGELVNSYYDYIMSSVPKGLPFTPLMTLYLKPDMRYEDIQSAKKTAGDKLAGVKIYPRGGTTNSDHGIPVEWLYHPGRDDMAIPMPAFFKDTLRAVADLGLVLNVHGEDPTEELLQRESKFSWSGFFDWYADQYPAGRIVFEHVTTHSALKRVSGLAYKGCAVGATVTLHHLYHTIDDAYCQPHNCCWPPPNVMSERDALCGAVRTDTGENATVFLGSDTAPHSIGKKECVKAACGCFTSPLLVEKLADFFSDPSWWERADGKALHAKRMAMFTSEKGMKFYGLKPTGREITLVRMPWKVPEVLYGMRPWLAGTEVMFRVEAPDGN